MAGRYPSGRIYNAKHEVQCIYKAARKVNLRVTGVLEFGRQVPPVGGFIIQNVKYNLSIKQKVK